MQLLKSSLSENEQICRVSWKHTITFSSSSNLKSIWNLKKFSSEALLTCDFFFFFFFFFFFCFCFSELRILIRYELCTFYNKLSHAWRWKLRTSWSWRETRTDYNRTCTLTSPACSARQLNMHEVTTKMKTHLWPHKCKSGKLLSRGFERNFIKEDSIKESWKKHG